MTDLSRIRGVALDFDGTLIEAGESIRPQAVAAIERATRAGIAVCTASGRSVASQVAILERNGLGPATRLIPALCVDERAVWLLDGVGYVPHRPWNEPLEQLWERLLPLALEIQRECLERLPCRARLDPEQATARGMVELGFADEAAALAHLAEVRRRVAEVSAELAVTQNWFLVTILAKAGGKGHAVAAMARAQGLAPDEMLAVGDRNNDRSMLDGSAGLAAAAVGNAVPEIRAVVAATGGYQAAAPMGLGVAEILDALIAARQAR